MKKTLLACGAAAFCLLMPVISPLAQEPPYNTPMGNAAPPVMPLGLNPATGKAQLVNGALPVSAEGMVPTYAAVWPTITMVSYVSDTACLTGSGTKTVKVMRVAVSASGTVSPFLYKRSSADSGGTTTTIPAITALDSNDPAPTASVTAYAGTGDPTTGSGTAIRKGSSGYQAWDFSVDSSKAIYLRGTSQQLCVGYADPYAGASGSTNGILTSTEMQWTEQ